MKYVEEFRDAGAARALTGKISALGEKLRKMGRSVKIMEVCGTHTVAIERCGIRRLMPESVSLISGPGCPVCVTDAGYIDAAAELAAKGVVIVTFGDMLNVPGTGTRLSECRSGGARIELCYSPETALDIAAREASKELVFLAVGFETTTAPTITLVASAIRMNIGNLSLLTSFKRIPPAMDALLQYPELNVSGFLCPAHVSAIIGADAYRPVVDKNRIPCVVAGFEPLDILMGICGILAQIVEGRAEVENQYSRVVRSQGNTRALEIMDKYLEDYDAPWRGIGVIPRSGSRLRKEFGGFDAERRFGLAVKAGRPDKACRCGEVLKGKIRPDSCPLFGKVCTPLNPRGPCMVSSEGTCAALYKYQAPEGR